ncbi:YfbU family protein [Nocardia sp. BMG51109]|uniref:YfbU family protein n=1 Tax=Nocardia sp. BMG51109 TaxID=1056816 RepID=UPI0004645321|nr:YfbU family protein [Nocardia sp. BMG51109]
MATITLRVDDKTRDELEALAQSKRVTVSLLLRDQIDDLLGRDIRGLDRREVPVSLTMAERLLLSQQAKILAALHPDEADHYNQQAEILDEGFAGEYEAVFGTIGAEMTRSECELVWDILDMFRVLGASIDKLSPEDRAVLGEDRIRRLQFDGFDLADDLEGRLLTYTQYLVSPDRHLPRWQEIVPRLEEIGDDGNSHHRCLPYYQAKLEVYQPIFRSRMRERSFSVDAMYFSVDELVEVAEATVR